MIFEASKHEAKHWAKKRTKELKAQKFEYGLYMETMQNEAKERGYDVFNISYHNLFYYKSRKQQ